jgi:tRNA-splicing ligase RtcB (3'-phosphate/5'-hydroxy nucleic acid ligase)
MTKMNITINQIKSLGNIPEELHEQFLRVANGMTTSAEFSIEKTLGLLAQMLENPKKYAYSKNRVTNLAQKVYESAINSASHGAERLMSRTAALN